MVEDIIPDDVRRFLLQHINSISQWEGLLLLRAEPAARWTPATLARKLYVVELDGAEILSQLAASGFLAADERDPGPVYVYRPKSPELDEMVGRAAALYAKYLVPVTNVIHSKPKSSIREFADAFKLRKD